MNTTGDRLEATPVPLTVEDTPGRYLELAGLAADTARDLLERTTVPPRSAAGRYVARESRRCFDAFGASPSPQRPDASIDAVREALGIVAECWEGVASGTTGGADAFAARPGSWRRLMFGWPMGGYGTIAAAAAAEVVRAGDRVLEVGAGVGATTRLLRRVVARHPGASLRATDVAYAGRRRLDVMSPVPPTYRDVDVVVATNTLHCVTDPIVALVNLRDALRPGGTIVIAEGAPETQPGVNWALNLVFGIVPGWFDVGGFRTAADWIAWLGGAGFVDHHVAPWIVDGHLQGAVFRARRPERFG